MHVWAIADLHLAFSVPEKSMEVFGEIWKNYPEKIADHWNAKITSKDLVLLPGDISWAMTLEEAKKDLLWIDKLPGTKVMIKGNHDYWWNKSFAKVQAALPPSIHIIQNNSQTFGEISIAGSRLWDSPSYHFDALFPDLPPRDKDETQLDLQKKIYERELLRLEMSLKTLPEKKGVRLGMTHYPPIGLGLNPSPASDLFEAYQVDHVVFGHLHNIKEIKPLFGKKNGVTYTLTSCDYLNFDPVQIV
jgi:uncharacterized protein